MHLIGLFKRRKKNPAGEKVPLFSIGICKGKSPFEWGSFRKVRNPVLTRENVTDVRALFVADPFMVEMGKTWYLFFEIYNGNSGKGEIALAKSPNGFEWHYQGVVLSESFHLSYPYVFKWKNEFYMIPESGCDLSIRLYRAKDFPAKWEFVKSLLSNHKFVDSSILMHEGKWWLFTEINPNLKHDNLYVFYAKHLNGIWKEHPLSPVVKANPHIARPAGRILSYENRLVRYAQDCYPAYGTRVRAFEISINEKEYQEREVSAKLMLGPSGKGWNADGMHHIDPHLLDNGDWIACVDGWKAVDSY